MLSAIWKNLPLVVLTSIMLSLFCTGSVLAQTGKITFESRRHGNSEIYIMNDDGTSQVNLTHNPATDINPAISPDGEYIAFASDRAGKMEIFKMKLDGSEVIQLTTNATANGPNLVYGLDWHPDGSKLIFAVRRDDPEQIWKIFQVNADGSGFTRLTQGPLDALFPRYSFDGTQIYMQRNTLFNGFTTEIYVSTAIASSMTRLTFSANGSTSGASRHPAEVLENGLLKVAFARDASSSSQQIHIMNTDGSGVQRISNNPYNEWWAVQARGIENEILFNSNRSGDGIFNIWKMNTDGSNPVQLTTVGGTNASWWAGPANQPPIANAWPDQTIECTSPQGSVVTLDGSNSSDPDNDPLTYTWLENGAVIAGPTTSSTSQVTLGLGSHTIELTVDDGNGGTDTDEVVIQVQDSTPPTIEVSVSPIVLWPPNHNYSSIDIAQYVTGVSDNCAILSASDVVITQVSSDEEEDAKGGGDGNTTNDIVITSCSTVDLRAERQGSGNGRVYTISLELDDGSGNIANASLQVQVPKSQNGNPAVDDGPVYTVNGNCNGIPKLAIFDDNVAVNETLPEGYALNQNYPNPFNPSTMISFEVPEASEVALVIYNLRGQSIRVLYSGSIAAGRHNLVWNGKDENGNAVASGIYLYKLQAGEFSRIKKMSLVR